MYVCHVFKCVCLFVWLSVRLDVYKPLCVYVCMVVCVIESWYVCMFVFVYECQFVSCKSLCVYVYGGGRMCV